MNALVGDNGIIEQATYAKFENEMLVINEAYETWKVSNDENLIPAKGVCNGSIVRNSERLAGEIGYYRVWNLSGKMPVTNLLLENSEFNNIYSSEIVYNPAGIEDLYIVDNSKLDIKTDKKYIIDASTGMIFSTEGFRINGISVYSLSMLNAVKTGNMNTVTFASIEVSGSGDGKIHAGNVTTEYLYDEDGNIMLDEDDKPIENPEYDPYGFQIIASNSSNNLFKLYNNGDLYGKGIKGTQLNNSKKEMDEIDQYRYIEFKINEKFPEIKECKQLIQGENAFFAIDGNDELWVLGENTNNRFGLSQEEQQSYTGREAVKLNVDGKKVSKVFYGDLRTYVVTSDNDLYVAGSNENYSSGIGNNSSLECFTKLTYFTKEQIQKIYKIYINYTYSTLIELRNGDNQEYYFVGYNRLGAIGSGTQNETYQTFTRIWNGTIGPDIDQDIKEIGMNSCCVNILKKDGTLWHSGHRGYSGGSGGYSLAGSNTKVLEQFAPSVFGCETNAEINIKRIYYNSQILVERENSDGNIEYWGANSNSAGLGLDEELKSSKYAKLQFPDEMLNNDSIKEVLVTSNNSFYVMNSGKVWASGNARRLGQTLEEAKFESWFTCITDFTLPLVETAYIDEKTNDMPGLWTSVILFLGKDGKIYTTGSQTLMYQNKILEQNWKLVAKNVKEFTGRSSCYVDRDNNLWVAGDCSILGFGEEAENYGYIYEYVIHPDLNIRGKVKNVFYDGGVMYVLTTDDELLATGLNVSSTGDDLYPGWIENEDKNVFVNVLSDVKIFLNNSDFHARIAIKNNGDVYGWGKSYGGSSGFGDSNFRREPTKYSLPSGIGSGENVKNLWLASWQRTFIVTNSGKLFKTGDWNNIAYDGGAPASKKFEEYTYNLSLDEDEKIENVTGIDDCNLMVLTSNGRVFGYGKEKYLGIGSSFENFVEMGEIEGLTNISQIVAGNGYYIAVTKDGKVYGTGSNNYGILGRWIGIGRGESNSRYKTAFNWVECPELEI